MESAPTGLPEGLARYLNDLLTEFDLPSRDPAPETPEVLRAHCGTPVATFTDPIPPPPDSLPTPLGKPELELIAAHIADGRDLHDTATTLEVDDATVAHAVTTLGGFTTKHWKGATPPRAEEPLGAGYRRSRKHPYSLERSALTIRGSHAAGDLTDDTYEAAAERLAPPQLTEDELTAILSFWVFQHRLHGSGPGNPAGPLAGPIHTVAASTRTTVNTAAEELIDILDDHPTPAPNLDALVPGLPAAIRSDPEARCSTIRALTRDPGAILPTRFCRLTPHQIKHIGRRCSQPTSNPK